MVTGSTQMRDRLVESEILLELALGAGTSLDLDAMLHHALPLYARKLGCAMVGVLDAEVDYSTIACGVPRDLFRNKDWQQAAEEISKRFRRGMLPAVVRIRAGAYYFHGFLLDDFGVLVLARAEPLSDTLIKDLEPVIRLFARSCGACRDYARSRAMERTRGLMVQLSEASAQATELGDFCQRAQQILTSYVRCDSMFVAIRNSETGLVEFPYFLDPQDPVPSPRPPAWGLTDYVLDSEQTFHMKSLGASQRLDTAGYAPLGTKANDWIGIPLRQSGRTYGVLAIQDYAPDAHYDEVDVQLMEQLGGLISEIVFRVEANAALRERDQSYRMLFRSMLSGFALHEIICDDDGNPVDYRYLEVNPSFELMTGFSADKIIGRTVLEIMPETEAFWIQEFGRVALTGEQARIEHYSQVLDKYFEVHAYRPRPGQFAVVFNDVSERIRNQEERLELERQMQHTQKLESLGLLAGGIAHDFNNLLMAMLGNLELAQDELPPGSEASHLISEAQHAATRATDLTRQMLAYSGKGVFKVQSLDVNAFVEENAHMLRAAIPALIHFELMLGKDLPAMAADPGQLQQVVMNLITNGAEAIEGGAGVVTLRTGVTNYLDDQLIESVLKEKPEAGWFVWFEVQDTGCGMDATTRQRLFDPFYTTKFSGRGLGLSAVHGIVRAHQGAIFIESEQGQGTTIRVAFPVNMAEASEQESGLHLGEEPIPGTGAGAILIAEDDVSVLRLCVSVAEGCGFQAIPVVNGEDAVREFRRSADKIVGVVLDLTMPYLDGIATLNKLREIRPDIRVILVSGYSEEEALRRVGQDENTWFAQKPFRLKELRALLLASFLPDAQ